MGKKVTKPGILMTGRRFTSIKSPKSGNKRQLIGGQAAIEYVLLVAITTLIFGVMFTAIRQGVFRLWVCDITPRVESAGGCNFNDRQCYAEADEQGAMSTQCASVAP